MENIIRDELLERILSGAYSWGDAFPSENMLAGEFRVSRVLIRKVLNILEEMGYLYSIHGKGRFLRKQQSKIPLNLNGDESFTSKISEAGLNLETCTISGKVLRDDEKVYRKLKAEKDEDIYRIERLRILDGVPIAIHHSYIREKHFPEISKDGDHIESLFAYFRKKGHHSFKSTQSILSVSLPTLDEQHALACPPLVPLLVLESDTIDKETEQLLQFTRILYRGDCFQYITH